MPLPLLKYGLRREYVSHHEDGDRVTHVILPACRHMNCSSISPRARISWKDSIRLRAVTDSRPWS